MAAYQLNIIDIADAIKAIKEPGKNIPAEQFWKKAGPLDIHDKIQAFLRIFY